MDDYDGADAIERAWQDGFKPDPLLTVSEWADRYRVLSQRASSEPGRWRTERTPYLKEIMDCLSPSSPVQRVALMKGAQIGGTECGNCWIGYGIKPSSLVEDGVLKDEIQRLWLAWTDEADADGLTDFYGLQAMAARAMFEAGECFFRFPPRRPDDGLTVPLQLQMLSSELLSLTKCETLPSGHEIIFGIELDRIGRRVAYHFHRTHPGDVPPARDRRAGEGTWCCSWSTCARSRPGSPLWRGGW